MPHSSTLAATFRNAFSGISRFFQLDRNGKIEGVIAAVTITAGICLKMPGIELALILLCCGLVIGLEMINSALEKLCDFVQPGQDPRIGFIKDVAAGAVLWASIISVIIGGILFLPYALRLLGL